MNKIKAQEIFIESLTECENALGEIAREIFKELKDNSNTYGDISQSLYVIRKMINYDYDSSKKEIGSYLLNKIAELISKEMNDLPLTNSSKDKS